MKLVFPSSQSLLFPTETSPLLFYFIISILLRTFAPLNIISHFYPSHIRPLFIVYVCVCWFFGVKFLPNLFCFILFLDALVNNIFKLHSYEILNCQKLKEPQFKSVLYCYSSKCLMSMTTITFIDFNFISKLDLYRSKM